MSWRIAVRILLIALAVGLAIGGLKGFALTPALWLQPYVTAAGVALGAITVPREYWLRAAVLVSTLASINVLASLARAMFSDRVPPPVDLETRGRIALGFAILYALPFCWWLWYSKRRSGDDTR